MYTKDATVIAPENGLAKGRDEIQAGPEEELALGDDFIAATTLEVERISDDTVSEIGIYTLKIDPEGGDPIIDEGLYVLVWKLGSEGEWILHIDIWNTSLPLG
jgi:ketosteroid isomerase-like protein